MAGISKRVHFAKVLLSYTVCFQSFSLLLIFSVMRQFDIQANPLFLFALVLLLQQLVQLGPSSISSADGMYLKKLSSSDADWSLLSHELSVWCCHRWPYFSSWSSRMQLYNYKLLLTLNNLERACGSRSPKTTQDYASAEIACSLSIHL